MAAMVTPAWLVAAASYSGPKPHNSSGWDVLFVVLAFVVIVALVVTVAMTRNRRERHR